MTTRLVLLEHLDDNLIKYIIKFIDQEYYPFIRLACKMFNQIVQKLLPDERYMFDHVARYLVANNHTRLLKYAYQNGYRGHLYFTGNANDEHIYTIAIVHGNYETIEWCLKENWITFQDIYESAGTATVPIWKWLYNNGYVKQINRRARNLIKKAIDAQNIDLINFFLDNTNLSSNEKDKSVDLCEVVLGKKIFNFSFVQYLHQKQFILSSKQSIYLHLAIYGNQEELDWIVSNTFDWCPKLFFPVICMLGRIDMLKHAVEKNYGVNIGECEENVMEIIQEIGKNCEYFCQLNQYYNKLYVLIQKRENLSQGQSVPLSGKQWIAKSRLSQKVNKIIEDCIKNKIYESILSYLQSFLLHNEQSRS